MRERESVELVYENQTLNVKIKGDIDHHCAKRVREKIDDAIFSKKPYKISLDLSEVDFMDSSGLGLILGRYTNATDIGAKFSLCNPNKRVKKILHLAGIERIMDIEGDETNEAY
ncbi:MAG: anti-sigma factor antagonist [Clostridia bacterium]|nr:anti-sigma factor antagonist [Clostridia bacterium]